MSSFWEALRVARTVSEVIPHPAGLGPRAAEVGGEHQRRSRRREARDGDVSTGARQRLHRLALTTAIVALVVGSSNFFQGSWLVMVLVPILMLLLLGINAHVQNDMPFVLAALGLRARDGGSRKEDHDAINEVLDRSYPDVVNAVRDRFDPRVVEPVLISVIRQKGLRPVDHADRPPVHLLHPHQTIRREPDPLSQPPPVRLNGPKVVPNVIAEVERVVRGLGHATGAGGHNTTNAHAYTLVLTLRSASPPPTARATRSRRP